MKHTADLSAGIPKVNQICQNLQMERFHEVSRLLGEVQYLQPNMLRTVSKSSHVSGKPAMHTSFLL